MLAREAQTTGTFRLKALYLCLEASQGESRAHALLDRLKTGKIFENETQPISVELWTRALFEFERLAGDQAFDVLHRYTIHPNNLGAWSAILRGSAGPAEAYSALGTTVTDASRIFLWATVEISRQSWIGEIDFGEDFSEDFDDGIRSLIVKALAAELRAIPLLYGRPPATVEFHGWRGRAARFRAEWKEAPRTLSASALGLTGLGMLAGGFLLSSLDVGETLVAAGAGVFGALVLGGCWMMGRDAQYRAATIAQKYRILALERESTLDRNRNSEVSRPHEEPVIASQYRVGGQLGVGAAGAVWAGQRLTDGKDVAIKLLRTAVATDGRATDRLRREAEALGLAWHPAVVEVYDQGLLPSGVAFLVMERLTGETLAERIQHAGRLEDQEVIRWGIEAAEALFAVHSAGVIHRDVKPSNLFLHSDAERTILKLFDFGVAQVRWAETRLTRTGTVIGTRGYAAPEQEQGEDVDERSDIYALGVTLIECLTGQSPRSRAAANEPSNLTAAYAGENASRPLLQVLRKMTETEPAKRFGNAREVKVALENARERTSGSDVA